MNYPLKFSSASVFYVNHTTSPDSLLQISRTLKAVFPATSCALCILRKRRSCKWISLLVALLLLLLLLPDFVKLLAEKRLLGHVAELFGILEWIPIWSLGDGLRFRWIRKEWIRRLRPEKKNKMKWHIEKLRFWWIRKECIRRLRPEKKIK